MRIEKLGEVEKENEKLRKEIKRREEEDEQAWTSWRRFPRKVEEVKKEVLELVMNNYMDEQVFYQEAFRRMALAGTNFAGITFTAETYHNEDINMGKDFSFIMCNINLEEWKDVKMNNAEITLEKMMKLGVIRRLYITKKKQLNKIGMEKLMLCLCSLLEQKETILECEFQTIPPSFEVKGISNAKSYILIRRVPQITMRHVEIKEEELASEASISIEDQISHYRSMVSNRPYINLPGAELVGEDADTKIFTRTYTLLSGTYQFSGLRHAHPERVLYYHKIRAYHSTTLLGDIWRSDKMIESDEEDDEKSSTRSVNNYEEDVEEANLVNMMDP